MTLSVSLSIYLKTQVFKVYDAINLHSSLCCREKVFEQKTKKSTASKLEHLQLNYCQKRMNWYLEMILKTFKLLNLLLKYNFIVIFDHQLRPYFALFNMHYAHNFNFFLFILFYYVPWMWKRKRWTPWSKRIRVHDVGRNKREKDSTVWRSGCDSLCHIYDHTKALWMQIILP